MNKYFFIFIIILSILRILIIEKNVFNYFTNNLITIHYSIAQHKDIWNFTKQIITAYNLNILDFIIFPENINKQKMQKTCLLSFHHQIMKCRPHQGHSELSVYLIDF